MRYLDEYNFNSDEDIKRFESNEIIEVDNLSKDEIISEIYSDLISDINFQDRMLFDFSQDKTCPLFGTCLMLEYNR